MSKPYKTREEFGNYNPDKCFKCKMLGHWKNQCDDISNNRKRELKQQAERERGTTSNVSAMQTDDRNDSRKRDKDGRNKRDSRNKDKSRKDRKDKREHSAPTGRTFSTTSTNSDQDPIKELAPQDRQALLVLANALKPNQQSRSRRS